MALLFSRNARGVNSFDRRIIPPSQAESRCPSRILRHVFSASAAAQAAHLDATSSRPVRRSFQSLRPFSSSAVSPRALGACIIGPSSAPPLVRAISPIFATSVPGSGWLAASVATTAAKPLPVGVALHLPSPARPTLPGPVAPVPPVRSPCPPAPCERAMEPSPTRRN